MRGIFHWLADNAIAVVALILSTYSVFRVARLDRARQARATANRQTREALAAFIVDGDQVATFANMAASSQAGPRDRYGGQGPDVDLIKQAVERYEAWESEVARYLRDTPTLGVEYADRFMAQVPVPAPQSLLTTQRVEWIAGLVRSKQERLHAFIGEFRADNGQTA